MLDGIAQVLDRRRTLALGDRGLIVSIVTWVMLVATVFTLLTRLALKLAVSKSGRKFGLDDVFIILAAIFSVGQTVAVSIESVHVLGQHRIDVTAPQLKLYQKAEYAGCMLYIANMGCSRISVCFLIRQILPGKMQRHTALGFAVLTLIWCIAGILVTAFPCHLPRPWDHERNKCINMNSFVNYIAISNCVMETLLISLPLTVWNLHLQNLWSRCSVCTAFAARFSVTISNIVQLVFFNRYAHSQDPTYDYWRTTLCIQVAQNVSVISACIPYFHPFILRIFSGDTEPNDLIVNRRCVCEQIPGLGSYFRGKEGNTDSSRSSSSVIPIHQQQNHYCAPLATYGLDKSNLNLSSTVTDLDARSRFQSNSPPPSYQSRARSPFQAQTHQALALNPSEMVFNRQVEIPASRRTSMAPSQLSLSTAPPMPPPETLSQVGVLPAIEYDTESDRASGGSSPRREKDPDYVFRREQVISVPERERLFEDRGLREN